MHGFMVAPRPDPAGFWQAISPMLRQAAKAGRPVRVFGEMVALLWDAGLTDAAIEVEAMWNELAWRYYLLHTALPRLSEALSNLGFGRRSAYGIQRAAPRRGSSAVAVRIAGAGDLETIARQAVPAIGAIASKALVNGA